MSFISAGFLFTIMITAFIYYLMPKKYQWVVLLIMSFAFYATYGIKYMGYIIFTIISSYIFTIKMEACVDKKNRRRLLIACLLCNFGILTGMKYINFFISNINAVGALFGSTAKLPGFKIIMPLGISFYTFQTMSYVIDVYQKKYEAQKNIFKLALFTAFLPQLLQGPIGRYDRLAPQFFEGHDFDIKNVEFGMQRMAWGLAKKLILADRAYVAANTVFSSLNTYSGVHIVFALLLFSIYVYCDFAGGMDLVIGASEIFGIHLDENFRQPYFSKNLGEFWRRWHISLGTWMKDYIFYPMSLSKGMNKLSKWGKKHLGNHLGRTLPICFANLVIFFIVGIWHGAEVRYIAYGLYNGIIIAFSNLCEPIYKKGLEKFHINGDGRGWKIFKIIRTFILVNIGWIFDCCALGMRTAVKMMTEMFTKLNVQLLTWDIFKQFELKPKDYIVIAVGCVVIFIVGIFKEKGIKIRETIASKPLAVRWLLYYGIIILALLFGYTDSGSSGFMYAAF